MTYFDYAVLAILAGSAVIATVRGLVAEVLSLGAWLVAFWCAKEFAPTISAFIPSEVPTEGLRLVAAFVLLFFLVWLMSALLRVTLTGLLDATGLGGVNRLFGTLFGIARGGVLVVMLVMIAGLTDIPQSPMWRNAVLSPPLERVATMLKPWLPKMLADNIRYSG